MRKFYLLCFSFALLTNLSAQTISLTASGVSYSQDFNTLSNTAGSTTNVLGINGWYLTEGGGGARDNEQYAVDNGGFTTGDMYSYGTTGSTERALGGLRTGTLFPLFGAAFTNNTGKTLTALNIGYTGEQWRLGTAGRTDRLAFEYSLNSTDLTSGTWTAATTLDFLTPITTTTGAKDGNAAGNNTAVVATISNLSIPNGATFWIRWTDIDVIGADDGLAVDNFSLTPLSTLPLSLTSFQSERQGKVVQLTWATAQEKNTRRFVVERSGNGAEFATIGEVAAAGHSVTQTTYRFQDERPLSTKGYYRLRVEDQDGTTDYSYIVSLAGEGIFSLQLLPNPAQRQVAVRSNQLIHLIRIFSLDGRMERSEQPLQKECLISVSDLGRGVHIVEVTSGGTRQRLPLVVQ